MSHTAKILDVLNLTSEWSDSKEGQQNGRYDGHFTVYLHMGHLKWDIKSNDFTDVRKALLNKGVVCSGIVQTGLGSHNNMTFQYVRKSQIDTLFEAIKEVLTKRLTR